MHTYIHTYAHTHTHVHTHMNVLLEYLGNTDYVIYTYIVVKFQNNKVLIICTLRLRI